MNYRCDAQMLTYTGQQHVHTCDGDYDAGDHHCPTCGYYWWVAS